MKAVWILILLLTSSRQHVFSMTNLNKLLFIIDDVGSFLSGNGSFLFSLSNPYGCGPFKLPLKEDYLQKANKKQPYMGPVFGENDLHLGAVSFSDLGRAYDMSSLSCQDMPAITSETARQILAGSYYFLPDEVEVFHLSGRFCNQVA